MIFAISKLNRTVLPITFSDISQLRLRRAAPGTLPVCTDTVQTFTARTGIRGPA